MKRSLLIFIALVVATLGVTYLSITRTSRSVSNPSPVVPVVAEPEKAQRPTTIVEDVAKSTTTSTPYFNETNLQGWRIVSRNDVQDAYVAFEGLTCLQEFVLESPTSDSHILFQEYEILDQALFLKMVLAEGQPYFKIGDQFGYFVTEGGIATRTEAMFVGDQRVVAMSPTNSWPWPISLPSDIENFMKNIIVP